MLMLHNYSILLPIKLGTQCIFRVRHICPIHVHPIHDRPVPLCKQFHLFAELFFLSFYLSIFRAGCYVLPMLFFARQYFKHYMFCVLWTEKKFRPEFFIRKRNIMLKILTDKKNLPTTHNTLLSLLEILKDQ